MKNGAPANALVEVNVDLIAEGALRRQIDDAIKEAHRTLGDRRDKNYDPGKCTINVAIEVEYDPDMRDTVVITHMVNLKTPKVETKSMVRERAGRLLCQPVGASENDPDQNLLFDPQGRPIGTLDRATGEFKEQPGSAAVVGKVGAGA